MYKKDKLGENVVKNGKIYVYEEKIINGSLHTWVVLQIMSIVLMFSSR